MHDVWEQFIRVTHLEITVGDVAIGGVFAGGLNGFFIQFHSEEGIGEISEFDSEESDAAIEVDEEAASTGFKIVAGGADEFGKEKEIVLEE